MFYTSSNECLHSFSTASRLTSSQTTLLCILDIEDTDSFDDSFPLTLRKILFLKQYVNKNNSAFRRVGTILRFYTR